MSDSSRPGPVRHLSIESATTSTSPGFSLLRRQSSKSSFLSHPPTPTSGASTPSLGRPWPAAMTMGHIRGMDRPGERALAYAAAIKGVMEADSGLLEWQIGVMRCKSELHGVRKRRPRLTILCVGKLGLRQDGERTAHFLHYPPILRPHTINHPWQPSRPHATSRAPRNSPHVSTAPPPPKSQTERCSPTQSHALPKACRTRNS